MLVVYNIFILLAGLILGLCLNFLVIDTFLVEDFGAQLLCTVLVAMFSSLLTIKSLK